MLFELINYEFLSCRHHSNFVNCLRFSPDGSKLISVSSDKKGVLYDAKTGDKIGELSSENGHQGSIYAVSWNPDSKQVVLSLLTQSIVFFFFNCISQIFVVLMLKFFSLW